jgi:hypothetical protein
MGLLHKDIKVETLPQGYCLIPTIVLPAAGSCISSRCPLVAPPSHLVITPAGCCITSHYTTHSCFCCADLSLSRHASWFLHILSSSSRCTILSSCHHASWLLCHLLLRHPLMLLLRHPLILSLRQLIVASPLVVLLMCCRPLVLSSRRLIVALPLLALPSCPLVVPPSC